MIWAGVGISIVILAIAYATRAFRPRSLTLPDRLAKSTPGGLLFMVTFIGGGAWIGGQVLYLIIGAVTKGGPQGNLPPAERFDPANLTPADFAFLATIPAAIGLVTLLAGDWLLGGVALRRGLGYDLKKLPRGVVLGVLAMLLTLPLIQALNAGLDGFYRLVHFEHPDAHELLGALGKSTEPWIRFLLMAGATLAAPLFEELLFRGHLQTVLKRLALWLAMPRDPAGGGFPVGIQPDGSTTGVSSSLGAFVAPPPVLAPPPLFDEPMPPPPLPPYLPSLADAAVPFAATIDVPAAHPEPVLPIPAWTSWLAILLTSVVFALVHPLWTAPLIFALSICLGYAYERTNNLWVSITMHAIFNGVQTAVFLYVVSEG
jgi:membrane protease YdiL (CAAX protease family)